MHQLLDFVKTLLRSWPSENLEVCHSLGVPLNCLEESNAGALHQTTEHSHINNMLNHFSSHHWITLVSEFIASWIDLEKISWIHRGWAELQGFVACFKCRLSFLLLMTALKATQWGMAQGKKVTISPCHDLQGVWWNVMASHHFNSWVQGVAFV